MLDTGNIRTALGVDREPVAHDAVGARILGAAWRRTNIPGWSTTGWVG